MSADPEIDAWRAEWVRLASGAHDSPVDARSGAVRQQFRLRAWHVLELSSAVAFLAFSAALFWRHPTPETCLWVAIVWASTLIATKFSVWNWHILWQADVKSVAEYASAYEKRCLATLRAVRFSLWFLAVLLTISVPWLLLDFARGRILYGGLLSRFAILGCWILGLWLLAKRQRRIALIELEEVRRSQDIPPEAAGSTVGE